MSSTSGYKERFLHLRETLNLSASQLLPLGLIWLFDRPVRLHGMGAKNCIVFREQGKQLRCDQWDAFCRAAEQTLGN